MLSKFYNIVDSILAFFEPMRKPQAKALCVLATTLLVLAFSLYLSAEKRYDQSRVWEKYPQQFFATGTPMMTTLDAYKYIRHAKEYRDATYAKTQSDVMIYYPEGVPFPQPIPMLSVIIEKASSISGEDLYTIAYKIVPLLAGLFMIPLAIYFYILGYPAAGLLGGLIGTFAPMYAGRTSVGRLDTDCMNIFFIVTASLFTLLASKAKKSWQIYIFAALVGLTINVFYWWYLHGSFNIIYFFILGISLFFAKVKVRDIAIALLIYIICSNPFYIEIAIEQLLHSINVYLFPVKGATSTAFPNVFETIGEAQKNTAMEIFSSMTINPLISIVGLLGFIAFCIAYPLVMIPLLPLILLGFMAFISAGRFSMFLSPFVGVGLGYIVTYLASYVPENFKNGKMVKAAVPFIAIGLIFFCMTIFKLSSYNMVPSPSIPTQTYQMFKDIKNEVPKNAAILTWWDYGLAIADAVGVPVFHSGMSQELPKTWLIARALTSDQRKSYNIISFIDNFGMEKIYEMGKARLPLNQIINTVESYDKGPENDADYILITQDMVGKYAPISYLASWVNSTSKGVARGFQELSCQSMSQDTLTCSGVVINLKTGVLNSKVPVAEFIITSKGNIVERRSFGFSSGVYVILDVANNRINGAVLLEPDLFNTTFVQLYFLNNPDSRYFSLAYDKYPYGRLFRVKKNNAE